jgi:hypothetical protein
VIFHPMIFEAACYANYASYQFKNHFKNPRSFCKNKACNKNR